MSSAGQNRKEGVISRDYRVFSGVGQACSRWIRCIEPPSRLVGYGEQRPLHDPSWVKRCPRCYHPNPGIRLHCERCRRIWILRG